MTASRFVHFAAYFCHGAGLFVLTGLLLMPTLGQGAELNGREQAQAALRKATSYFNDKVSAEGGCVWQYSADLQRREGEKAVGPSLVWIQPPGTPTLGTAYLTAYERTGEKYLLDLARQTAGCLLRGQLQSGGWDYSIELDPAKRNNFAYRTNTGTLSSKALRLTTLDDNNTQSVLRLLMRLDQATEFKDHELHEAIEYALQKLIEAQYPNGAWAQRFSEPADPALHPVKSASYPETWSRTFPNINYKTYYTFNDGAMLDVIDVMLEAARLYDAPKYRASAEKAGDFIRLAQLPEPQPTWAQQYDAEMHPAWARKFEPPSVTGGESQKIIKSLLQLYRHTGDKRFLEPVPAALAWLKRSEIAPGELARFYELKTNRPLYFTTKYELTYDDNDLPTHYGFKIGSNLVALEKEYADATSKPWQAPANKPFGKSKKKPGDPGPLPADVRSIIAALDEQGRWLEQGKLKYQQDNNGEESILRTATFVKNVDVLSKYIESVRADGDQK